MFVGACATAAAAAAAVAAAAAAQGSSIQLTYLLVFPSLHYRDKYGFISKENEFGNHPVHAMGGIHFKPNPKGLDFLGVAEEFMVHSLGEIISGCVK